MTSIKLMTQYKDRLDELGIDSAGKKILTSLQCNIKSINCVLYEEEDQVNDLIEKLHTSKPGVSQVKWDPQAQDRHQFKSGNLSKRLALIELLRHSKHTSSEAKSVLSQRGWTSKLKRYVGEDYLIFFGIRFDKENNILLHLKESEVLKGLSQLVIDLKEKNANEIAQTAEVREQYINDFPIDKIPDRRKINNPIIKFNVISKKFETTNIYQNKQSNSYTHPPSDHTPKNDVPNDKSKETDASYKTNPPNPNNNKDQKGEQEQNNNEHKESSHDNSGVKSTTERTTLIPKEENIPIKNQRTRDLYEELKIIHVGKYKNVVSIAFRSLIEFSINCFLEKSGSSYAFNERVYLFDKLEKVVRILERDHTKPKLEKEMPAIYRFIDAYKAGQKNDPNSISFLNILIHSHNYHPIENELKVYYNNYSPLLKRIWEKI